MTNNAAGLLFWHRFVLLERAWFHGPQAMWADTRHDTVSPDDAMLQLPLLGELRSGTGAAATLGARHPSLHGLVASRGNSYICGRGQGGHCGRQSEEAPGLCLDVLGLILLRGKEHFSGLWYKNTVCYRLKKKISFLTIAETTTEISEMQINAKTK